LIAAGRIVIADVPARRRLGAGCTVTGLSPRAAEGGAFEARSFVVGTAKARWPGFVMMENQIIGAEFGGQGSRRSRVECRP
jgi:hypothetical protein